MNKTLTTYHLRLVINLKTRNKNNQANLKYFIPQMNFVQPCVTIVSRPNPIATTGRLQ